MLYISSAKYSLQERKTSAGKVYDVYFYIFSEDMRRRQKKLCGFKTKTAAKEAYTEFVTKNCSMIDGVDAAGLKRTPAKIKAEHTVGELIPVYLRAMENQNKSSSVYDKAHTYEKFILPSFADTKMTDLTREVLRRWQDELWTTKNNRGEFFSSNYLSAIRGRFCSFLSWAEESFGYKNNFVNVSRPKDRKPKRKMDFWTEEEFSKFISAADDNMYRCFFTVLFYTGRRPGEVRALQKADIKNGKILWDKTVTRKTLDGSPWAVTSAKTDKELLLPTCEKVLNELAEYGGGEPFFFGGERPLPETSIRRVFDKWVAASGVRKIRVYDMRHSFASLLAHNGANLFVVASLIGDTVEQVTETYGHLYISDQVSAIEKLNQILL